MSCHSSQMLAALATGIENASFAARVFTTAHRLGQKRISPQTLQIAGADMLALIGAPCLPDDLSGRPGDAILCEACGHAAHRMRTLEDIGDISGPLPQGWAATRRALEAYARHRSRDAALAALVCDMPEGGPVRLGAPGVTIDLIAVTDSDIRLKAEIRNFFDTRVRAVIATPDTTEMTLELHRVLKLAA